MNPVQELDLMSVMKTSQACDEWNVQGQRAFKSAFALKAWIRHLLRTSGVRTQDLPDAYNDVLVKAVTKIDQLRHPNAFKAWLRRIVTSVAKKYRVTCQQSHPDQDPARRATKFDVSYSISPRQQAPTRPNQTGTKWITIEGRQYAVRVFEPQLRTEQQIRQRQISERFDDAVSTGNRGSIWPKDISIDLRTAIAKLPKRWALVILLVFFGGYTRTEVASILGCSRSRTYKLLKKGKNRLRELLTEYPRKGNTSGKRNPARRAEATRAERTILAVLDATAAGRPTRASLDVSFAAEVRAVILGRNDVGKEFNSRRVVPASVALGESVTV
jgi:RNA polymerase sigma factor (sigma-70 family)